MQRVMRQRQACPYASLMGTPASKRRRQVLVVAGSDWMAPDGRGTYFCAVVEPW
jgi:hypothetical protein